MYDTRGFCSADPSRSKYKWGLSEEIIKLEKIDLFISGQEMYPQFDEASLTALQTFGKMVNK